MLRFDNAGGGQEQAVAAESLYHVMWRMNQRCNYKCVYCFREGVDESRWQEHPDCGRYAPEHIGLCFDGTGKRWRIHMTGGEPLLYPRFVELAARLGARHQLSINTNLSTDSVFEFGRSVPVSGVYVINATAHIGEQEKCHDGLRRFIERATFLQERGFRIRVMYVTYPPLLGRMEEDIGMFAAAGIRECVAKVFRGWYDGRVYPGAYSRRQKSFIRRQPLSDSEMAILDGRTSFRGRRCVAGHRAFYMDIAGDLTRCCTMPVSHGNLFRQDYHFDEAPGVCEATECNCPYQGMKFAQGRNRLAEAAAVLAARARSLAGRMLGTNLA